MKNIALTSIVLILLMNFNFNRNLPVVVKSFTVDTVENKKAINSNTANPTDSTKSISKVKSNNKIKLASNKTKSLKRNSKTKFSNKAASVNQTNLKLHKKMLAKGMHVKKGTVKFGFDKNTLQNNTTFNEILHIADKLIFDSTLQVSIAGFTDNIGSAEYNDILSLKRAQQVKDYLTDLGVNETQIHLSFNGMSDPASDNSTTEGRAENRRVEFVLFSAI